MSNQSEHSSPSTSPAKFRLPYTGESVPASLADITVKITGEARSREGVAFSADVKRGKDLLGIIENQGNGGGTWFQPYGGGSMNWWLGVVEEFKAILIAEEYEYGPDNAAETLADRLYENVATYRDLNRKRNLLIRFNGDMGDVRMYTGQWDAQMAAHFAAEKVRNKTLIERWVKNEGWVAL